MFKVVGVLWGVVAGLMVAGVRAETSVVIENPPKGAKFDAYSSTTLRVRVTEGDGSVAFFWGPPTSGMYQDLLFFTNIAATATVEVPLERLAPGKYEFGVVTHEPKEPWAAITDHVTFTVTNKVRSIPRYAVTILPGGTNTIPARINNKGHVVGVSDGKAFLYDGQLRSLGTLGGAHSAATSINNNDQIVGVADDGEGIERPFLWEAERGMVRMAVSGNGTPADINDLGDVVGSGPNGGFLYRNGRDLQLPLAYPSDFNNYGMAVGGSIYNTELPARWDEFYRLYWGVVGEDGPARLSITAINDANELTGADESSVGGGREWTIYAYRYHAYRRERVTPWGGKAAAHAINRWGDIVGSYRNSTYGYRGTWESDGPPHAFLATREGYSLINDLLENGGGVDVVEASSIDDRREIVGLAKVDGEMRAVLLTPRPEFQSIALDSIAGKIKLAMSAMVPTRVKIESSSNLKDWTLDSSREVNESGVEVEMDADGEERYFRIVPE